MNVFKNSCVQKGISLAFPLTVRQPSYLSAFPSFGVYVHFLKYYFLLSHFLPTGLGLEPRASCVRGECSTTQLLSAPRILSNIVFYCYYTEYFLSPLLLAKLCS